MSRTNCPNCGAPSTPNAKCAYCGTYFFDLAHVPINEPFVLSVNVGTKERPSVITSKVYTSGAKFIVEPIYDAFSGRDLSGKLHLHQISSAVKYEFSFISIGEITHEEHTSV